MKSTFSRFSSFWVRLRTIFRWLAPVFPRSTVYFLSHSPILNPNSRDFSRVRHSFQSRTSIFPRFVLYFPILRALLREISPFIFPVLPFVHSVKAFPIRVFPFFILYPTFIFPTTVFPPFIPPLPHSFPPSFIHSLPPSFIHSLPHSFIPSLIHSHPPSFIPSLTHSFPPSLPPSPPPPLPPSPTLFLIPPHFSISLPNKRTIVRTLAHYARTRTPAHTYTSGGFRLLPSPLHLPLTIRCAPTH